MEFSFGGLYWTTHKNLGYIYGLMIGYIGSTQQKQKVGEVESILVDRRRSDENTLALKQDNVR